MESATEVAGPPRPQPQVSSPLANLQSPPTAAEQPPTQSPRAASTENPAPSPLPQDQSSISSARSRAQSGVVPPWWQRHERNASRLSQSSLARSAEITLEDHTADPNSETTRGLWARSVFIDDHCIVQGLTGVGAYVVWNCTINTLDVSSAQQMTWAISDQHPGWPNCCPYEVRSAWMWPIRSTCLIFSRYSEFDDLRQRLISSFPHARKALPELPPKSVLCTQHPDAIHVLD